MWTPTTRRRHGREGLRHGTDLSDGEWHVIEPRLPGPCRHGRPRARPPREIVNAIFCVLRGGTARRLLPSDFPPWRTVYRWFSTWRDNGVFEKINRALLMADRERVGREASPSAAIIDSQSVETTEAGGPRRSTPTAEASSSSRSRPTSRTATAAGRRRACRGAASRSSRKSSPTAATPASGWRARHPLPSRSCARTPIESASPSIPGAGSSSASSPGSAATAGLPRTSRPPSPRREPSSTRPPSCSPSDASHGLHDFRDGL